MNEAARGQLVVDFDGLKAQKYDSSSDFTDDIELLEQVVELLDKFINCKAVDHWLDETESNYGSSYKPSYIENLAKAIDDAKTAVKEFNEHMYGLDE